MRAAPGTNPKNQRKINPHQKANAPKIVVISFSQNRKKETPRQKATNWNLYIYIYIYKVHDHVPNFLAKLGASGLALFKMQ